MFAISEHLQTLLSSLPPRPTALDVEKLVKDTPEQSKSSSSTENRRTQWELLLRNEVLALGQSEGSFDDEPELSYFDSICDKLDLILAFSDQGAVDEAFIFTILQDLLETQTISSCSHIFSWIERRAYRLTNGMVSEKGKALMILRTLNDLLRRISRTGDSTTLCGRILTFLSAAFPLSERSGVNLRGDYGPQWEVVTFKKAEEKGAESQMEVDEKPVVSEESGMVVDNEGGKESETATQDKKLAADTEAQKRENIYNTFWSLQLPFSRPSQIAVPGAFEKLKNDITFIMPIIKEATIKERAMMGSKAVTGNLKRKRDATTSLSDEESNQKYFFSKFLTSPDLLELEIADTSFRRQFLFQLLVFLSHLLQFTTAEKVKWYSARNRSLQMDFTLEPDDAKWVQDQITKIYDEIKQTAPNGRAFSETVQTIIEREKNWVRWKNGLCEPFDMLPLDPPLDTRAKDQLKKLSEHMEEYQHKLGSEALSEIWAMGYRDLDDLTRLSSPGSVKDFAREIDQTNKRINLRKTQLEKQARARAAVIKPAATSEPKPTVVLASAPAPITPAPQRVVPPSSAASPPLHPSLPAKPGTQPVVPPHQPSPAPTPQQTPAPVTNPAPAAPPVVPEAKDPMIMKFEESLQRTSWLALRLARDEYLHLFGKIGEGDVVALMQEIEKEKEKLARGASVPVAADVDSAVAPEETESKPVESQPELNAAMETGISQSTSVVETTQTETKTVSADQDAPKVAEAETSDTTMDAPAAGSKMVVDS